MSNTFVPCTVQIVGYGLSLFKSETDVMIIPLPFLIAMEVKMIIYTLHRLQANFVNSLFPLFFFIICWINEIGTAMKEYELTAVGKLLPNRHAF